MLAYWFPLGRSGKVAWLDSTCASLLCARLPHGARPREGATTLPSPTLLRCRAERVRQPATSAGAAIKRAGAHDPAGLDQRTDDRRPAVRDLVHRSDQQLTRLCLRPTRYISGSP